KQQLHQGLSYPVASNMAYKTIGFNLDVLEPNNILGFSYTKEILSNNLPIELYTFKRINNTYHDELLQNKISSESSIINEDLNFYNIIKKTLIHFINRKITLIFYNIKCFLLLVLN